MCGLAACLLGASVTLTDVAHLDLMAHNAKTNLKGDATERVCITSYEWGKDASALHAPFDLVLCSDCLYNEDSYTALINAFDKLTDEKSVCVCACVCVDVFAGNFDVL